MALEKFEDVFKESVKEAGKSLTSLVSKECSITYSDLKGVELDELTAALMEKDALITIDFKELGNVHLFAEYGKVSSLADLLLLGEGKPKEELADEDRDAIGKAFSQVSQEVIDKVSSKEKMELSGVAVMVKDEIDLKELGLDATYATAAVSYSIGDVVSGELVTVISPGIVSLFEEEVQAETQEVSQPTPQDEGIGKNLDLLLDIDLRIIARIGNIEMRIEDVLELGPGSIIELNKGIDEPVDLFVNNKLIAKGDVVVVDEKFGIRINEIVDAKERIKSLRP